MIDIHFHFFPPELQTAMQTYNQAHGGQLAPFIRNWSPQGSLEVMDKAGIETAVLSLASMRGVWFGADPANWAQLSRACNECAAEMVRNQPGRFGLFASLPLPDVDAALAEITYAFDVLGADGIGLPTSFGDVWPGDARFAPVFEELDRRGAMVVFHPCAPNCCSGLAGLNESYLEYPYDTGRSALSLLFGGTFAQRRNIRWTFCHGGGPIPVFAARVASLSKMESDLATVAPDGVEAELQRLYYDTANAGGPAMRALLDFVPPSQIMFGTDWPYVSPAQNVASLECLSLPAASRDAILRGNAERLIARLRIS
jgi:6-methylsalicylate decarboxylase